MPTFVDCDKSQRLLGPQLPRNKVRLSHWGYIDVANRETQIESRPLPQSEAVPHRSEIRPYLFESKVTEVHKRKVAVVVEPHITVRGNIHRVAIVDWRQAIPLSKFPILKDGSAPAIKADQTLRSQSPTKNSLVEIAHSDSTFRSCLEVFTRIFQIENRADASMGVVKCSATSPTITEKPTFGKWLYMESGQPVRLFKADRPHRAAVDMNQAVCLRRRAIPARESQGVCRDRREIRTRRLSLDHQEKRETRPIESNPDRCLITWQRGEIDEFLEGEWGYRFKDRLFPGRSLDSAWMVGNPDRTPSLPLLPCSRLLARNSSFGSMGDLAMMLEAEFLPAE